MTLVDHGEKGQTPVENCTTRSLEDMNLSTIPGEVLCAMTLELNNLQFCSALRIKMDQRSPLQLSRHIEPVVKMELLVDAELLPMLAEEAETS